MPHPLEPLAALAHADGGWGYVADQPAHLEPTCLALLALRPEAERFGPAVALDGMTFTVEPGQVTGFVGPNGAGKSTTMRVILGLDARLGAIVL